jgi:hypothetical protein
LSGRKEWNMEMPDGISRLGWVVPGTLFFLPYLTISYKMHNCIVSMRELLWSYYELMLMLFIKLSLPTSELLEWLRKLKENVIDRHHPLGQNSKVRFPKVAVITTAMQHWVSDRKCMLCLSANISALNL